MSSDVTTTMNFHYYMSYSHGHVESFQYGSSIFRKEALFTVEVVTIAWRWHLFWGYILFAHVYFGHKFLALWSAWRCHDAPHAMIWLLGFLASWHKNIICDRLFVLSIKDMHVFSSMKYELISSCICTYYVIVRWCLYGFMNIFVSTRYCWLDMLLFMMLGSYIACCSYGEYNHCLIIIIFHQFGGQMLQCLHLYYLQLPYGLDSFPLMLKGEW